MASLVPFETKLHGCLSRRKKLIKNSQKKNFENLDDDANHADSERSAFRRDVRRAWAFPRH